MQPISVGKVKPAMINIDKSIARYNQSFLLNRNSVNLISFTISQMAAVIKAATAKDIIDSKEKYRINPKTIATPNIAIICQKY